MIFAKRPAEFSKRAETKIPPKNLRDRTIRSESKLSAGKAKFSFTAASEIRQRARLVNSQLRPDLVLCLHFNAEAWGDERNPELIDRNHLHLLVNGSYLPPELESDDDRFEMLQRLLSRAYEEEVKIADAVGRRWRGGRNCRRTIYDQGRRQEGRHEWLRLRAQSGGDACFINARWFTSSPMS